MPTILYSKDYIFILVYVDDILVLARDFHETTASLGELAEFFDYHHNGSVRLFLGMDVIRQSNGLFLHQQTYIRPGDFSEPDESEYPKAKKKKKAAHWQLLCQL